MKRLYLITGNHQYSNLSGTAWEEHPTIREEHNYVVTRPELKGEYVNLPKNHCFPLFVDIDTDFKHNLEKELE